MTRLEEFYQNAELVECDKAEIKTYATFRITASMAKVDWDLMGNDRPITEPVYLGVSSNPESVDEIALNIIGNEPAMKSLFASISDAQKMWIQELTFHISTTIEHDMKMPLQFASRHVYIDGKPYLPDVEAQLNKRDKIRLSASDVANKWIMQGGALRIAKFSQIK